MMTENRARLQFHRLQNTSLGTWLSLVVGSWIGLAWGSLISAPVGIGIGVAAGSASGGFLAVPIWGTLWGLVGLGRQRENAVKEHGITLLDAAHPVAQRTYALCERLGMKARPWVATMPHSNAYAIGANAENAMVVIGQPLLDSLTEDEVDAIIGHELGHIANNDMRRLGLARSFQNSLVWYLRFSRTLQRWASWMLTWASELMVLGLSRKREYWADAIGASLTNRQAMISALEKLHQGPQLTEFERQHARLMFRGLATGSLLSTHPTLDERRSALAAGTYLRQLPFTDPAAKAIASQPLGSVPDITAIAYAK